MFSFGFRSTGIKSVAPPVPFSFIWSNANNCLISANTYNLKPNGGSDSAWDQEGRNFYSQIIFPAGEPFDVEYRLGENESFLGVTRETNNGNTYADIEFSTYRTGNQINCWESGVAKNTQIVVELSNPCRIIWNLVTLKYFHNGIEMYESLLTPDITKNFKLKGNFYHTPGSSGTTIISINGSPL